MFPTPRKRRWFISAFLIGAARPANSRTKASSPTSRGSAPLAMPSAAAKPASGARARATFPKRRGSRKRSQRPSSRATSKCVCLSTAALIASTTSCPLMPRWVINCHRTAPFRIPSTRYLPPRWTLSKIPPGNCIRSLRVPWKTDARCSATEAIWRPINCARRPRAMVSTSGSSGMKILLDRFDQRLLGRLSSGDGNLESQAFDFLARARADRRHGYVSQPHRIFVAQQYGQMPGGGGAGADDRIGAGEQGAGKALGTCRENGAIGGHAGHDRAAALQLLGDLLASAFCAGEEDGSVAHRHGFERRQHALGVKFLGHQVRLAPARLPPGGGGGGPNGADEWLRAALQVHVRDASLACNASHGIRAGKDAQMELAPSPQGIEQMHGLGGGSDRNRGKRNRIRAQRAQAREKGGALIQGPGDDHAPAAQRQTGRGSAHPTASQARRISLAPRDSKFSAAAWPRSSA